MYYFKILNQIKLDYFFKFVVHKLNSKMIKIRMVTAFTSVRQYWSVLISHSDGSCVARKLKQC
jgi:hypothetical protein